MKLNLAKRKNSELRSSTLCRPENGRSDQIKNLSFSGPHTVTLQGILTDAVRKLETAEKWHLSNLSHTPKYFCPMMVLTIGHKIG